MTIQLKATDINPGNPELTISTYEWSIDGIITDNNTDTIIIDLGAGSHEISLRIQNSCGSWSNKYSKIINITGDTMEKIITVVVDQPVVQAKMALDFVGNIDLTVTDQLDRPVSGASITLDDAPTGLVTGLDGNVLITNVPYGTHTVKGIKEIL